MKNLLFFALAFLLFFVQIKVQAQNTIWLSPLTFTTGNPDITIIPLGSSIQVNTSAVGDFQWIYLGLNIHAGQRIDSVLVYYQLSNSSSFISQIRLTKMTTPDVAFVIHDDPTDLTSTIPTYHSSFVNEPVNATITLALRLNYSSTLDFIKIGAIAIVVSPVTTSVFESSMNNIADYKLEQNYPNPFNPTTIIEYQVPEQMNVKINIYNINGQLIKEMLNEEKIGGKYSVVWDGMDDMGNLVATGTYFYQIQTGDFMQAKKMIFLK